MTSQPPEDRPPAQIIIKVTSATSFEIWVLVALLLATTLWLFGFSPVPASVQNTLGPLGSKVWAGGLMIGCSVSLFGMILRDVIRSLLLEAAGLMVFSASILVYCLSVGYFAGVAGTLPALLYGGLTAAAAWRIREIFRQVVGKDKLSLVEGGEDASSG